MHITYICRYASIWHKMHICIDKILYHMHSFNTSEKICTHVLASFLHLALCLQACYTYMSWTPQKNKQHYRLPSKLTKMSDFCSPPPSLHNNSHNIKPFISSFLAGRGPQPEDAGSDADDGYLIHAEALTLGRFGVEWWFPKLGSLHGILRNDMPSCQVNLTINVPQDPQKMGELYPWKPFQCIKHQHVSWAVHPQLLQRFGCCHHIMGI